MGRSQRTNAGHSCCIWKHNLQCHLKKEHGLHLESSILGIRQSPSRGYYPKHLSCLGDSAPVPPLVIYTVLERPAIADFNHMCRCMSCAHPLAKRSKGAAPCAAEIHPNCHHLYMGVPLLSDAFSMRIGGQYEGGLLIMGKLAKPRFQLSQRQTEAS